MYPAFYENDIWVAVALDFVKVRNVREHPRVNLHYQVLEANDMETLLIGGIATVRTGLGIRRDLWNDVFDYDLNSFSPGGPETAEEIGFLQIAPNRAVLAGNMGSEPRRRWLKSAG